MSLVARAHRTGRALGIDRAIAFTVMQRIASAVAGMGTLVMVASNLTPVQQGFHYTFASVLALQIFFELGLSFVLLQVVSHERAHLDVVDGVFTEGAAKGRLADLFRKAIRWYAAVAVLVVIGVMPAGVIFFGGQAESASVAWLLPWCLLVVAEAINVVVSPMISLLEGCGFVAEMAGRRLAQTVAGSLALWVVVALGGGLFGAAAMAGTTALVGLGCVVSRHGPMLRDLWRHRDRENTIDWRHDIWRFQWRIAVSWLSGYFIFQLFNPLAFKYGGAVDAGRMGMSLAIVNAISGIAISWITTKSPRFGNHIARGEIDDLHLLFGRAARQSVILTICGGLGLLAAVGVLQRLGMPLGHRFLDLPVLSLLVVCSSVNSVVFAEAAYLRAHKEEPFMMTSILCAVLIAASGLLLAPRFGVTGIVAGYTAVTLVVSLGGGTAIFLRKRRQWYGATAC